MCFKGDRGETGLPGPPGEKGSTVSHNEKEKVKINVKIKLVSAVTGQTGREVRFDRLGFLGLTKKWSSWN